MAEVGKNLKKLRKEKNLTQDELAARLHCTRQTISNYENGKSEPGIALLVEIADVLGVEANDLIYGPKEKGSGRRPKTVALVALAAAGVLLLAIEIFTPFVKEFAQKYFAAMPMFLLRYALRPLALALLGWGIVETAKAFGDIRPWEGRPERTVRLVRVMYYVLAAVLAVFAVLALWTAVDVSHYWYLYARMRSLRVSFDSSTVPRLMPEVLEAAFWRVTVLWHLDWGLPILGAALALCRIDKKEAEKGKDAQ